LQIATLVSKNAEFYANFEFEKFSKCEKSYQRKSDKNFSF